MDDEEEQTVYDDDEDNVDDAEAAAAATDAAPPSPSTIIADDFQKDDVDEFAFNSDLLHHPVRGKCLIYEKGNLFGQVAHSPSQRSLPKLTAAPSKSIKTTSTSTTKSSDRSTKKSSDRSTNVPVAVDRKQLKNAKKLYDALAGERRKRTERISVKETRKPTMDEERNRWIYRRTASDKDADTQTIDSCMTSSHEMAIEKSRLAYLMGLDGVDEYSGDRRHLDSVVYEEEEEETGDDSWKTGTASIAMRRAQKYLRSHRVFEFYQFLVAHLLSATPENPIEFLTGVLDKCMIYRGGFAAPPLLYDCKHLESLFNLMDPMRTGHINMDQYKVGMRTLGICGYNERPPKGPNGVIAKQFFVDEAHDCLINQLNEMIRKRWLRPVPRKVVRTPPPTLATFDQQDDREPMAEDEEMN